jgi:tetratricopeptide (TPR) repeat protein
MGKKAVDPYKQGLASLAAGDLAGAKKAFAAANAADAKSFQVEYNLGVVADRQGQPDEALQRYGRALRLQPDYELAVQGAVNIMLRRNNTAGAVAYAEPIARQWERNLYLQAILADALTRADRVDEAEQVARKALRRDERFVPAIVSLSKASARRGRKELAESMLAQANEIDPNYAEVHFLRGKDFQAKGDLAQALSSYRKAVELRPDYAEARMALGIQFMASGNYGEALTHFEAAAKLVSTLPATYGSGSNLSRTDRARVARPCAHRVQHLPHADGSRAQVGRPIDRIHGRRATTCRAREEAHRA